MKIKEIEADDDDSFKSKFYTSNGIMTTNATKC